MDKKNHISLNNKKNNTTPPSLEKSGHNSKESSSHTHTFPQHLYELGMARSLLDWTSFFSSLLAHTYYPAKSNLPTFIKAYLNKCMQADANSFVH